VGGSKRKKVVEGNWEKKKCMLEGRKNESGSVFGRGRSPQRVHFASRYSCVDFGENTVRLGLLSAFYRLLWKSEVGEVNFLLSA